MACSFSAVADPSRLSGSRSSQARYSSCSATSVATAVAHRCGRGGARGAGARGVAWLARRSLTRCRAWRSAGVIGTAPMRCAGILSRLLASVTSRFWMGRNGWSLAAPTQFLCSTEHRFSVPSWLRRGAARSAGQGWPLAATAPRARGLALTERARCHAAPVGAHAARRKASFLCSCRSSMLR